MDGQGWKKQFHDFSEQHSHTIPFGLLYVKFVKYTTDGGFWKHKKSTANKTASHSLPCKPHNY